MRKFLMFTFLIAASANLGCGDASDQQLTNAGTPPLPIGVEQDDLTPSDMKMMDSMAAGGEADPNAGQ